MRGSRQRADASHGKAVMSLVHRATARASGRATLELTVRQRLVVQALGLEGSRSIAAIGQRLGCTPSTMTGLVDRLEEQGLLRRARNPSDRRATVLCLTRRGERVFRRELDFYRTLVDQTLAPLEEDARHIVLDALSHLGRAGSADAA